MTNEEAVKYGTEWLKDEYLDAKDGAFIKMALEALRQPCENKIIDEHYKKGFANGIRTAEWRHNKQEPCEDCISRQAVLDYTNRLLNQGTGKKKSFEYIQKYINKLPPVTPQPKMGRWIADVDKWGDIVTTVNGYRCSECNAFNTDKDNFCSNCGAKMEVDE